MYKQHLHETRDRLVIRKSAVKQATSRYNTWMTSPSSTKAIWLASFVFAGFISAVFSNVLRLEIFMCNG